MARAHEHAVAVATARVRTEQAFRLTDLRCTHFDSVESRFFRLFTPVKPERNRLPTTLPEFAAYKYTANLSDSPLTAARKLGGSWRDHNLAAITHLAACNLRCRYCYVDRPHLAGRDSFEADPAQIVEEFEALHERTGVTILRVSGGEPLLAPDLPARLVDLLASSRAAQRSMVKVESNMTTLTSAFNGLALGDRRLVEATAGQIMLHVTVHGRPGSDTYRQALPGIRLALELGYDLYPAIGGADWRESDLTTLHRDLGDIDAALPLRLAVRPFQLDYPVLACRPKLDDLRKLGRNSAVIRWEKVLQRVHGRDYLATPRDEVRLASL